MTTPQTPHPAQQPELGERPPATRENLQAMGASAILADHTLWALQTMRALEFDPESEVPLSERFTPEFLAAVPPETLAQTRQQMLPVFAGDDTPWIEGVGPHVLSVIFNGVDGLIRMQLQTDPQQDERIAGFMLTPAIDLERFDVHSWDEINAELQDIGGFGSLYVGRIGDGQCAPLHSVGMTDPMPLGSAFKLWVLSALVADIDAGLRTWDDTIVVQQQLLSLPSGTLQNEPIGSEHSLLDVATLMISISDNTATDHLIAQLGREQIEAHMVSIDPDMAAANTPLLTTRDLFAIKGVSPAPDFVDSWAELDTQQRRLALQTLSGRSLDDFVMWNRARWIESFEWYATGDQLCRTWARLLQSADSHPELDVVLGTNPGVPMDDEAWPRVWYKGGSEPGVLAMSWLMQNPDGEVYSVTLQNISLFGEPPLTRVVRLARALSVFLASDPAPAVAPAEGSHDG